LNSTTIYINDAAQFAHPILAHFRKLVLEVCPDIEETLKWNFPHFINKNEIICSMAAFKSHCAFSFPKAALMKDETLINNAKAEISMGHLGKITNIKDLPSDKIIKSYIKESIELIGTKISRKKPNNEIIIPEIFLNHLKKNKQAFLIFNALTPSHKKEYIKYISEAKKEKTQLDRIAKTINQLILKNVT
jgi:uncharacterized protein YdeI (YjbR/CyaY-like superfamily)